jgi:hypothetical protein
MNVVCTMVLIGYLMVEVKVNTSFESTACEELEHNLNSYRGYPKKAMQTSCT